MMEEGIKAEGAKSERKRHNVQEKNSVPLCLCASVPSFTLIELLTVIAVMAMIIAIAAPAFVGIGRGAGMRGAVSGTKSTLSLLRQWAITHRERVSFYYYQNVAQSASYYYAANEFGTVLEKTNELPMEVAYKGSGKMTFKTDGGLASGSAPTNIVIADRKAFSLDENTLKKKTISINGLTGGIHVE